MPNAEIKTPPLAPNELRNIEKLNDALNEIEAKNNVVQDSEFAKFIPLIKNLTKDRMEIDAIVDLTSQFVIRFNPYAPITIVNFKNEILFKIPQLFVPVHDISREYNTLLNKFHKDGGSDIPRYAAEATHGVIDAIVKSQIDVTDGRYTEYINAIAKAYAKDAHSLDYAKKGDDPPEYDEDDSSDSPDESIDDMEGLNWG